MAFGEGPLSHPLLVEAAETLFHPVVIRNNVEGYEKEVLERFKEPTWNNPVVRFLNADAKDVIPRKDRQWSIEQVATRMTGALRAAKQDVPAWWRLVTEELASGEVEVARFAMTWYWEGEAQLGALPGVVMTAPAWVDKREIVEVTFRPEQLTFERLLQHAVKHSCDQMIFTGSAAQKSSATRIVGEDKVMPFEKVTREAKASDRLYYLKQSEWRWMPLTPLQARRVNSALHAKQDPLQWISPRQAKTLARLKAAMKVPAKVKALQSLKHPRNMMGLVRYAKELNSKL